MVIAVVLTVGKYLFLLLVYLFVYRVFRGMMAELTRAEAPQPAPARSARAVRRQRAAAPSRRAREPVPAAAATSRPAPVPAPPPASEPPPRPRLVVVKAAEDNEALPPEIPLSAAATIGRGPDNSITLNDRYVSGHHAQIHLREGRRFLLDRGSTNGTLLNGRPITGEVEIGDRDQISIGATIFEYRMS